jgi:hypothetical protein
MEMYGYSFMRESDIQHHGIKGQKWGVRRFQNEDGTWTAAGKARYGEGDGNGSSSGARSIAGTARRALAKVYDANARYYEKRGNSAMASMNKAAKDRQLEKASQADQRKADKEQAKDERLHEQLKNAETARIAEYTLNKIAKRDLQRGQNAAERVLKDLSGWNSQVAKQTTKNTKDQVIKDRKEKMTRGQKVVNALLDMDRQAYEGGGYKKLSETYANKQDDLMKSAKRTVTTRMALNAANNAYKLGKAVLA